MKESGKKLEITESGDEAIKDMAKQEGISFNEMKKEIELIKAIFGSSRKSKG